MAKKSATQSPTDVAIVGLGLAGSCLAWQLHWLGANITIFDSQKATSASRVSSGIVNPISGKRLTVMPNYRSMFSRAAHFYQQVEKETGGKIWYKRNIKRLYENELQAKNDYLQLRKYGREKYARLPSKKDIITNLDQTFIPLTCTPAAQLAANQFIDLTKSYFSKHCKLHAIKLQSDDINFTNNSWQIGAFSARSLVLAIGVEHKNWKNDCFLPFRNKKGQFLRITTKTPLPTSDILYKNYQLVHNPSCSEAHSSLYFGATYDHNANPTETTTNPAAINLQQSLKSILGGNFTTKMHGYGWRPVLRDRLPAIGALNPQERQYIFNGLGSKGVLIAPTLALQLANHILYATPLSPEFTVRRFF